MTSPALSRFLVTGQCAVITGGGDGIGRAAALLFAEAGAAVAIIDTNRAAAETVAGEITAHGGAAAAWTADVSDEPGMERALAEIAARFSHIDILINNAAIAIRADALSMPLEDWNKVVAVNLTGMFIAARLAARHMRGRGGAVVNTASIVGLSGGLMPNIAYQTTKGGVVNMTRALALEWTGENIRVNAVAPTYVRTKFIAPLMADKARLDGILAATPMGRLAEPEEVANAMLFLASPAAAMITGVILPVDGGFLAR
jgi:NAD(P)-dependent dehydrogenase (short-subunit alcohol dehydrogenase family)